MSDSVLARLGTADSIRLRWVLRDLNSKQKLIYPARPDDLARLKLLGLITFVEGVPALTESGVSEIETIVADNKNNAKA